MKTTNEDGLFGWDGLFELEEEGIMVPSEAPAFGASIGSNGEVVGYNNGAGPRGGRGIDRFSF